jgi:uncharacterized protein
MVAMTIIVTWLFNNTRGSVSPAMLLPAGANAVTNWLPLFPASAARSQMAEISVVEWVLVLILVVRYGPEHLSRNPRIAVGDTQG